MASHEKTHIRLDTTHMPPPSLSLFGDHAQVIGFSPDYRYVQLWIINTNKTQWLASARKKLILVHKTYMHYDQFFF